MKKHSILWCVSITIYLLSMFVLIMLFGRAPIPKPGPSFQVLRYLSWAQGNFLWAGIMIKLSGLGMLQEKWLCENNWAWAHYSRCHVGVRLQDWNKKLWNQSKITGVVIIRSVVLQTNCAPIHCKTLLWRFVVETFCNRCGEVVMLAIVA